MTLLQAIVSVIAGVLLLSVLVIGLLLILKPLESARGWLEQITMGVRAIRHQAEPLGSHADDLAASIDGTTRALEPLSAALARAAEALPQGVRRHRS